jgi:hypothetical protein
MSNTIGTIFYGFPLNEQTHELYLSVKDDEDSPLFDDCDDESFLNFNVEYAAHNTDIPVAWFGLKLDKVYANEGCHLDLKSIEVPQDIEDKVKTSICKMPQEIKDISPPLSIYIIWSSS